MKKALMTLLSAIVSAVSFSQGSQPLSVDADKIFEREITILKTQSPNEHHWEPFDIIYITGLSSEQAMEKSIEVLHMVVEDFKTSQPETAARGHVLILKTVGQLKQKEKALAELKKFEENMQKYSYPRYTKRSAWLEIGKVYEQAKEWDKAIEYYKKSLPGFIPIAVYNPLLFMGRCYKEKGDYQKALQQFNRILDDYKGHPKWTCGREVRALALYYSGEVYEKLNEPLLARKCFKELIEKYSDCIAKAKPKANVLLLGLEDLEGADLRILSKYPDFNRSQ